ncbi:MAG: sugar transferase [Crocinitomicaceae bacterium]|nr:sugar transferase [Crocinitomicaceae bacterium]
MYYIAKRCFDIFSSLIVLTLLFPLLFIVGLWIVLDSEGGMFYRQKRIGKNGRAFYLLKFRSMRPNSDKSGQITVGNDQRVTKIGKFIRKYKIDEFPQLLNVIKGDMSIVGPRPEVPEYTRYYTDEQKKVLTILPGLTDYATLEYIDEQVILGKAENPEEVYITQVMPDKLQLNLRYLEERSFLLDIKLIFRTIRKIIR